MEIAMNLLMMLGGVAVFMFGMKQMSTGLERSAGSGIRTLFRKMNKNRVINYFIGIIATMIVQSSSASSIMTIGLAHANIVTVKQGSGFILGAKVGTTVSAVIFALSGISKGGFSITSVFAAVAFVGVMIVFTTNNQVLNKIAPFLIGFGMLFIGLEVMEMAIGGADSVLSVQLSKLFQYQIMQNPILLVILGSLFAAIIQSSSAASGVFIAFLATGVISNIDQSFFLMIGANIGTCSDGIMASLTTNANGKRIALFHVLTSILGGIVFTAVLIVFRLPIVNFFNQLFPGRPQFSLAAFNMIYNILYTLVLLVFLDTLVNFVTKTIKDKQLVLEEMSYIEERFLQTPAVAIEQTLRELIDMAQLAKDNLNRSFDSLISGDMSDSKKIADSEYRIDFLTNKITGFLIRISSVTKTTADEELIGGLHHVTNDIERLGDYAVLLVKEANDMKTKELKFMEQTKEELTRIYQHISELFSIGINTFSTRSVLQFKEISVLHKTIELLISETRDAHVIRLNSGMYPVELSKSIYSVLFHLQRVSDHIVNIAFSIRSTTGSKTEALQSIEKDKRQLTS